MYVVKFSKIHVKYPGESLKFLMYVTKLLENSLLVMMHHFT